MDKGLLIDKYKNNKKPEKYYLLEDGGIIIGQEADENNHMIYIIQRGDSIIAEAGTNLKIKENLLIKKGETVIREGKK